MYGKNGTKIMVYNVKRRKKEGEIEKRLRNTTQKGRTPNS